MARPHHRTRSGYFRNRTVVILVAGALAAMFFAVPGPADAAARATNDRGSLGSPHPAIGRAVTVGMISDGGSGTVATAPLVEQGAHAAVAYENEYGDGLDGHRIDLFICENQETPAGGQLCANDMVQHAVVAVVEPFTGQGQTEVPTIVKAGIPYITMSAQSTAELTTSGAFALQGGFAAILGAVALQARQEGYKKVALIVANVPAVVEGATAVGDLVFKAAGVGLNIVAVDPGTSDMTPQLQAAVTNGASAIGVAGDVTLCGSFLRAYATLGLTLPRYVVATCLDPSILDSASLDRVMRGSWLAGAGTASPAQDALYAGIVRTFTPRVNANPNASANVLAGMLPILSLAEIMRGYAGSTVSPAAVRERTATLKAVPIPMFGSTTFTCNGTAIPLLPSVCSSTAAIGVVGDGYAVRDVKNYNPTRLF
ncbi:MAG TPA: ABC transporter substrate-binding protein [Acidimicrobiales bacterium]